MFFKSSLPALATALFIAAPAVASQTSLENLKGLSCVGTRGDQATLSFDKKTGIINLVYKYASESPAKLATFQELSISALAEGFMVLGKSDADGYLSLSVSADRGPSLIQAVGTSFYVNCVLK